MDNIEKQFEDFVNDIRFDDVPSAAHRDKLEQSFFVALNRRSRHKTKTLKIWRIIMKSQITKLAAVAVVIAAVSLSVTIFNSSTSTAWAIEQSIEVLSQYKAVIVEGMDSERSWIEGGSLELKPFKAWAVANENQTMVEKYRYEVDGVRVLTTNGKKTWRYDPKTNAVRVENRPYIASECWCGSRFLEQIKSFIGEVVTDWDVSYGKDPETGRRRAFLKIAWLEKRYNGPRSMWLEFDIQSKLPIGFKQWENANWEGPPTLVVEKITYYQNFPDEFFEFVIPEGATVVYESNDKGDG